MSSTMTKSKALAVCAMCIALAFMLNQVSLFRMPQGGSITPASMLFIVLAGYWLGPVYGFFAGIAMGLLNTATGAFVVHPVQYALDYLLAPGMLGLSGLFRNQKFGLHIGYVAGVFGRFLMVFLSGLVFFGILAGNFDALGMGNVAFWPAFTFSIIYNISYIGPELIATLVIISLPAMKHAIDVVTKSVVPHDVYLQMTRHKGSVSAKARLVTGAVVAGFGGLAFVLVSYITRLESFAIAHHAYSVALFTDEPTRLPRMIERNTGQITALQTAGVLLLTLGVALAVSVLMPTNTSCQAPDTK